MVGFDGRGPRLTAFLLGFDRAVAMDHRRRSGGANWDRPRTEAGDDVRLGLGRIVHCRFVLPPIHFIPDSRTYSSWYLYF